MSAPSRNAVPATWVLMAVATAGGLLLGPVDLLGQVTLPYPWANLANSPAVWAVAAFAVGAWGVEGLVRVSVAGALLLVLAVEGYYASAVVFLGDDSATFYSPVAFIWMGFGVVAGVVFGIAGAWYRSSRRWQANIGLAALGGVFIAEALKNVLSGTFGWSTALILTAVALLVPLALGRTHRHRLESLALVVPLALVGVVGYLIAM
ncbi:hypothetical protein DP939_37855 [Spongiactinospora rosea]|uniref:Uncharacterized protein n=1 Tax=Spongiactinospora rosea TaxID=2248750 RepID=A0A366LM05_9ACTN|nr:DUF6518 family protein [Spongiactinospora rosea]RBQ14955.1 hypothetical protein DP939_37855 [Spongiactinospora rosea]